MLQRRERCGSGPTVMARDEYDVRVCLAHAGRDGPDTHLGDELDVHSRTRVRVLQVVNELLEVFDRVDVVVRRRRDQPNARRRMPRLRDPRIDLAAWQLTTLARLCPLR